MKRKRSLNAILIVLKLCCAIQIIFFLITVVMLINWQINSGSTYYGNKPIIGNSKASHNYSFDIKPNIKEPSNAFYTYTYRTSWFTIGKQKERIIRPISIYLNCIKNCILIIFTFLCTVALLDVIKSLRDINTFRTSNIQAFRNIGKYQLILFLVSGITIIFYESGSVYRFSVNLTPLLLMVLAYIMAEIFKEGNTLLEENIHTI